MPALNFKPQFADLVSSGQKTQTIRQVRKHPIKVGDSLWLYTGMRTKACRPLADAVVTEVARIEIDFTGGYILVNGKQVGFNAIRRFVKKDGFDSISDFWQFFKKQYNDPIFHGVLIKWRLVE